MPNPTASGFLFSRRGMGDVARVGDSTDGAGPETGGTAVDTSAVTAPAAASMPLNPAPSVNMAPPTNTADPLQNFINWWENEFSQIWVNVAQAFMSTQYTPLQAQQMAEQAGAASGQARLSASTNPFAGWPVVNSPAPAPLSAYAPPGPPLVNPQIPVSGSHGPETPGVGQYIPTQSFLMSPAGQAGIRGLGCACGCGGCGCGQPGGMGTLGDGTGFLGTGLFNGNGLFGAGLFEAGWDVTTWGPAEWAVMVIGGYVVFSTIWTTGKALEYGGRQKAKVRSKVKRATTFNLLGM